MILKGYSKALYSNWYYYAPDRLLFDLGEGAGLFLRQEVFAVQKIFISHGHVDHFGGLLSFLCLRQGTKGDNEKALQIYYPAGDRSLEVMQRSIREMLGHYIQYQLEWIPLNPGDRVPLQKGRFLQVHRADHPADNPLIFVICEERKKLKGHLHGRPGQELAKLPAEEKFDYYTAKLFAYSGDSMPVNPEIYRGAAILLHEATFLVAGDRRGLIHSTAQEVFDLAK
ncbi:MAG: MBL fold metallo-hydrolase, partial [Lentisphaerae bacterium]